jgi:hypothetical protein
MSERTCGINSLADRRYYHFVVVKTHGLGLAAYWRRLQAFGEISRPTSAVSGGTSEFRLEHRKFLSHKPYARGATAEVLSERGNGRPPFYYDLFAAKIEFREGAYLVMGFPFASLALDLVDHLIADGVLRDIEFQGVDLGKLLSEKNRPLQHFEGLTSKVVGVQFVVTDDKSLTAVRLGGNDPFHAQIYESFLKRKFEEGLWMPDQCVLACERGSKSPGSENSERAGLRSRLRIDKSGNFKFYAHVGCVNVILILYAISQIRAVACLKQVLGNPLRRIDQEENS